MRPPWRRGLAILLLIALGCGGSPLKPANVLLITVDTLRPDRLGYSGNTRPTSPAIDRLAREGVVFRNAYSEAGWTLPSIASILSGRYPKDHGAVDFESALRDGVPTLATILRGRGYDTRGYVSHLILTPHYGVAQGFDHFDDSVLQVGLPSLSSTDRQLTDNVNAGLADIRQPYFLWVHYFGPHYDYLWHAGWESFGRTDRDRYDQEIAHTDSHIGRLLDELRKRGLYDDTVVVFVSDHGEEFGEHGGVYHYTLHGEVMRVPLIIRAPGLAPRSDSALIEQVDVLPTILGLLRIAPDPGAALPGRDALAATTPHGPLFFERNRPSRWHQRGVLDGHYKLVVIEEIPDVGPEPYVKSPPQNIHPGIYLYDVEADPGETKNLYAEGDERARALLGLLQQHFAQREAGEHKLEVNEDLRAKLRDLGYGQ